MHTEPVSPQIGDRINLLLEQGRAREALAEFDAAAAVHGASLACDVTRGELLGFVREEEARNKRRQDLGKGLRVFAMSPLARFFQSVALRWDPPRRIEFDDNHILIETRSRRLESTWENFELVRLKVWERKTKHARWTSRIAYVTLANQSYKIDCSERTGDFDLPEVFLDMLKAKGKLPPEAGT